MSIWNPTSVAEAEDRRRYFRDWQRNHPLTEEQKVRRRISRRSWLKSHPHYHRDWKRKRSNEARFVIERRLRSRIHSALQERMKADTTFQLLGCSIGELKAHLESLFLPGMTWDNRGAWHIDHIRPCASFDLLDPEQQRCCFHYSNLQPLWAADNLKKSAKILGT